MFFYPADHILSDWQPQSVTVPLSGTLIPKILYIVTINSLLLFWCPYMVISVSVQYNGGLLPDIILLTLCDSIEELF